MSEPKKKRKTSKTQQRVRAYALAARLEDEINARHDRVAIQSKKDAVWLKSKEAELAKARVALAQFVTLHPHAQTEAVSD